MSDANKALAEVRRWLCDNLGSSDAGKVCGMLSVVSRRINELEVENVKLRELANLLLYGMCHDAPPHEELLWSQRVNRLTDELGIEDE